ncbi:3-oxoacyl-ACP reductase [Streptomyces sp. NPDC054833]
MADRYLSFTGTAPGRFLARRLGLPQPARLCRRSTQTPSLTGPLLHLTAGRSDLGLAPVLARTGLAPGSDTPAAVVLDATGVRDLDTLAEVHSALHPAVRSVARSGRVLVLGAPLDPADHHQAAAQQALEGFTRSLGKEIGRGRTVNLVRLTDAAAAESTLRFLLSPGSACISGQVIEVGAGAVTEPGDCDRPLAGRTALVTDAARGIGEAVAQTPARGCRLDQAGRGQRSGPADPSGVMGVPPGRAKPRAWGSVRLQGGGGRRRDEGPPCSSAVENLGKSATDDNAAGGSPLLEELGAARTRARDAGMIQTTPPGDGAQVVVLDVPAAEADARRGAERLGGTALALDITAADAGGRIAAALPDGLDVLVHNAGVTRDRRPANMPAERWSSVMEVNLGSVLRTTDALLASGTLRPGGRIVATASIAGLAGNAGQTNYGASKAGVVGLVRSLAPRAAARHGVTVNAVAPGFIETRMTAAIPLLVREAGRRMNSLAQGGLPVDVAETTAWLAHPASGAVNGQVVRVCGQSLLGA